MAVVYERRFLKCPYQRAKTFLEDSLSQPARSGASRTVMLTVPIRSSDGTRGLEKAVLVTYAKGVDAMHFDEPWIVHWEPKDGGPYPSFDGSLTVRADDDFTTCCLELRGEYTPPLGAFGAAFNAVVGAHIAAATAQQLLKRVGKEIESTYEREESEKRGAREHVQ